MLKRFPWDYHPDLNSERLTAVADLIRRARGDALDRHNPDIGDDPWTLGCSAYQFCRFRITQAAGDAKHHWLSILDGSLQFIFGVGNIPVRFYRGEAEDPSAKTCHVSFPELNQLAIAFPDAPHAQLAYRFAVETDFDGSITSIKFVGLHGKSPVFSWEVPYDAAAPVSFPLSAVGSEGVELPAPVVSFPRDADEDAAKDVG